MGNFAQFLCMPMAAALLAAPQATTVVYPGDAEHKLGGFRIQLQTGWQPARPGVVAKGITYITLPTAAEIRTDAAAGISIGGVFRGPSKSTMTVMRFERPPKDFVASLSPKPKNPLQYKDINTAHYSGFVAMVVPPLSARTSTVMSAKLFRGPELVHVFVTYPGIPNLREAMQIEQMIRSIAPWSAK